MTNGAPGRAKVADVSTQRPTDTPGHGLGLVNVSKVMETGLMLEQVIKHGPGSLIGTGHDVHRQLWDCRWHMGAEYVDRPDRRQSLCENLIWNLTGNPHARRDTTTDDADRPSVDLNDATLDE